MSTSNGRIIAPAPVDLSHFKIGFANLEYGGIDPKTRDDTALRKTISALAPYELDVLAVQEVDGGGNPNDVWRTFRRYANAFDMEPVLGPSIALRSQTGNHTGVLVRTRPGGLRIEDQWPPPGVAGHRVPWCMVEIHVPGLPEPLYFYSLHASARSQTDQRRAIEVVTNQITASNQRAVVMGDFNGFPREPELTSAELATLPHHLQLTRCIEGPDGLLVPNYGVYDTLIRAGLLDVTAVLADSLEQPELLHATGLGGARVDRCHASKGIAYAATGYWQVDTGSDHDAGVIALDLRPMAN
jgi:endonuclease/exonuclease/phosphatase family metal-dependent hydrolase